MLHPAQDVLEIGIGEGGAAAAPAHSLGHVHPFGEEVEPDAPGKQGVVLQHRHAVLDGGLHLPPGGGGEHGLDGCEAEPLRLLRSHLPE